MLFKDRNGTHVLIILPKVYWDELEFHQLDYTGRQLRRRHGQLWVAQLVHNESLKRIA